MSDDQGTKNPSEISSDNVNNNNNNNNNNSKDVVKNSEKSVDDNNDKSNLVVPSNDEQSSSLASASGSAMVSSTLSISPPCSEKSVASTSSSRIPRQTGIRPPSRIGRPCGGAQKPAIPATPTKNNSDDSIRRITDDFGRHRLTDLVEADESEEDAFDYLSRRSPTRRKRYSSIGSTASSMEGLWDIHPRRLSEAGLSRHSDQSAILTEDTDSFMIGQRVWVGGTKPGTIAYIGETQFAPGDWAGIALDEPIGKNDGSVAGIRYFQCENKKGVFSRLTRLTRVPLEQPGFGSNETFIQSTPTNNGVRRSPISPTGSTRSLLKSPVSMTASNTSLTSSAHHVDFKIGDRVIIKSTQGSKVGMVRYIGLTDFAPGEWVGVELDDPRGKNDGSVEGKRYFECRPNFGLFAPISKVSKSPSKHKPGSCVVHSGGGTTGLPPSGMRRANSKESMASATSRATSIASSNIRRVRLGVTSLTPKVPAKSSTPSMPTRTALQDVIKEKQQHIEQLMKERDLERAEITRAAIQADEAEHKLVVLQHEYEQYKLERENKMKEHLELISELKQHQMELLSQLEDEKRKNEDILFKFEEANITKTDIEVVNEANEAKIKELQEKLAEESKKAEMVESLSNKLFETEENLIKTKDQLDTIKKELERTKLLASNVEQEKSSSEEILKKLQDEIDNLKKENEEKQNKLKELESEIKKNSEEHQNDLKQLQILVPEIKLNNATFKDFTVQLDKLLKNKLEEYQKLENDKVEIMKDCNRLKQDLSVKALDLDNANDKLEELQKINKVAEEEIQKIRNDLDQNLKKFEEIKKISLESEQQLIQELETTKNNLMTKENLIKELETKLLESGSKSGDIENLLQKRTEEIKQLQEELKSVNGKLQESHDKIKVTIDEYQAKMAAKDEEIKKKNEELNNTKVIIQKLEDDSKEKKVELEKLQMELESIKQQNQQNQENSTKLFEELSGLKLVNSQMDLSLKSAEQKIAELTQIKEKLEQDLKVEYEKCTDKQLEELRKTLDDRDKTLNEIREELLLKSQNFEREKQEIEFRLGQKIQEIDQLRAELEGKLQVSQQSEEKLKERCESILQEKNKIFDETNEKIRLFEQNLIEKNQEIEKLQNDLKNNQETFKNQLDNLQENSNKLLKEIENKCENFENNCKKLKEELEIKNRELEESKLKYEEILVSSKQGKEEILKTAHDNLEKVEKELRDKTVIIEQTVNELNQLKESFVNLQNSKQEITVKCDQLLEKLNEKDKEINVLKNNIEEKEKYYNSILENSSSELTKQLQNKQEEIEKLKNICENLESELTKKSELLIESESKSNLVIAQLKQEEIEIQNNLNTNIKKLETDLAEKSKLLEETLKDLELLKTESQNRNLDCIEKDQRINQLISDFDEKQNLINTLQDQVNNLQTAYEDFVKKYNEKDMELQNLTKDLNVWIEKSKSDAVHTKTLTDERESLLDLLQCLKISESDKNDYISKLKREPDQCKEGTKSWFLLNIVKDIPVCEVVNYEDKRQLLELNKNINELKELIKEKDKQIEKQNVEISLLQQQKISAAATAAVAATTIDGQSSQLLEDKQLAEDQIRFLNSIIVDIQKKNEEQRARIEILEAGCTPAEADEELYRGAVATTTKRQIPPRMYCDICEEFDLHETEDCPQQLSEETPNQHNRPKSDAPQREYCEICEVFGHATEDCQDDGTF